MTPAPTPCRESLGSLRCSRDGGHQGLHRAGLTVWTPATRMPEWLKRGLPAKDYTRGGAA